METQEYRALREKRDELWSKNENLSEKEIDRFFELQTNIENRVLFAERKKDTLDEDIFILKLSRDYGKEAEKKYYQLKLLKYLKEAGVLVADENADFRSLLEAYCPEDWKFLLERGSGIEEIRKRTGALNFDRRLQEIRDDFCLSG